METKSNFTKDEVIDLVAVFDLEPNFNKVIVTLNTEEIDVCQILPVKFTGISGQRVGPRSIKLIFSAEEDGNIDHYNIQYSLDGKTFNTVNILFPNGVVGGKQYSVIVNY